jgi:hypothetical protein
LEAAELLLDAVALGAKADHAAGAAMDWDGVRAAVAERYHAAGLPHLVAFVQCSDVESRDA